MMSIDLYSTDSNKVVREALAANSIEILTTEVPSRPARPTSPLN